MYYCLHKKHMCILSGQVSKLLRLGTACTQPQPYLGAEWAPGGTRPRRPFLVVPKGSAAYPFCLILNFRLMDSRSICSLASGFFGAAP